jgi:hypothetical protein
MAWRAAIPKEAENAEGAANAVHVTFEQLLTGEVVIVGQLGRPVGAVVQAEAKWLAPVASKVITKNAPTETFSISSIDGTTRREPLNFSSRDVEILPGSGLEPSVRGPRTYRLYETIEFRGVPGAAWNGAASPIATAEEFAVYSKIHIIAAVKKD